MARKEYLPLGSIVRLKGGTRKLIIIGINQITNDNEMYDYSATLYPYGYVNSKQLFLFNEEKVEEIVYKGYSDKEMNDYWDDFNWALNKKKEEQNE